MHKLSLLFLKDIFAICKLKSQLQIPIWLINLITDVPCQLLSITKTDQELSIVCAQDLIPNNIIDISIVKNWRAFKVDGILDFSLTGISYSLLQPLTKAKISIFSMSTYNTDYMLVQEKYLDETIAILNEEYIIKSEI